MKAAKPRIATGCYSTELSKGQGMIRESVDLLRLWEPGMTTVELKTRTLQGGLLGRATALRVNDIVGRVFAHRYLGSDGIPARWLKQLVCAGVPPSRLTQLFFIYTARVNPVLHDFVTQSYWPKYSAGDTRIVRADALRFLHEAAGDGRVHPRWTDTMMLRVARYLTGCLTDFGLAGEDRQGVRPILPFRIETFTTVFLVHELHFTGCPDNSVLAHADWRLFGLDPQDTLEELKRSSNAGRFILQSSGDLLRISWTYKTMEECLDDLAQHEL